MTEAPAGELATAFIRQYHMPKLLLKGGTRGAKILCKCGAEIDAVNPSHGIVAYAAHIVDILAQSPESNGNGENVSRAEVPDNGVVSDDGA